ncbi:MAG: secretin N-terminal domain-containing protein [Candidatus Accumulibacter sp. UW26]|jgi:general secretion pathway protein D
MNSSNSFFRCRCFRQSIALTGVVGALLLGGCANQALQRANELATVNQYSQALAVVDEALVEDPGNPALRAARQRLRERAAAQLVVQVDALRVAGRYPEALVVVDRLQLIDPQYPRVATLRSELERAQRHDLLLAEARQALQEGRTALAEARLREVAAESPGHPALRSLQQRLAERWQREVPAIEMGATFQKVISLEFREAPLRDVFEALAHASGLNFVFDREVRGEGRVTVFLRNVSVDEALRVILSTQQLDRKLLNQQTVLIYPDNQGKQREHQELITRTLYLANADVKQAQNLVRTIAKVRDIHVDDRLNALVIRDTPEVVTLVERLLASLDLPEPEVMLEIEVMEIASDQLQDLGLQWPEQIQYGIPGFDGQVALNRRDEFRSSVANPAVVAHLRGTAGTINLLANPKIRVRNHEKAKVHIGEKLAIFTTTTTANVGVAASISYLDVGLKLDVEPNIGLDGDVTMRIGLEVSNRLNEVKGPSGALAYNVGTRLTTTSLRLADGETQILSGLINDEDSRSATGIPGLSALPVVGALFGVQTSTRKKTELVMLITPRIVRSLSLPDAGITRMAAGTDAYAGAVHTRLRPAASAGVGLAGGGGGALSAQTPPPEGNSSAAVATLDPATSASAGLPAVTPNFSPTGSGDSRVILDVTPQTVVGGVVTVTLRHTGESGVRGEIRFDATRLRDVQAPAGASGSGRVAFELGARGERVIVLRALPGASDTVEVTATAQGMPGAGGETPAVRVEGSGTVQVEAASP